jgi:hypothetical protein
VLLETARRLDPPRLRRAIAHLRLVADPEAADRQAERRHQQRGVWLAPTWEGMVAIQGLLEAEAGQTLLAALEPLARPADARDERTGGQRNADALAELAAGTWRGAAPPERWGAPAAAGDGGPGHPAGAPGWGGWGRVAGPGRLVPRPVGGWPVPPRSPGSWSPAGPPAPPPMWAHQQGPGHPPALRRLRQCGPTSNPGVRHRTSGNRQPRRRGAGGAAPDRPGPVAPDPGWGPQPAAGCGPGHPGRLPRPTRRPDRP